MTAPSFTTLLDWVDDRLGSQDAAAVERFVARSPEAQETVDWIREFRDAGRAAPLARVPKSLSHDLRAAFRRHRAPWITGVRRELDTTFDSREQPALAGMRSVVEAPLDHLAISAEGTEVKLTLVGRDRDVVDVHGIVSAPESVRPEIVISSTHHAEWRSARPGRDGRFVLHAVDRALNEVWVLAEGHHVHGFIDLRASRPPDG